MDLLHAGKYAAFVYPAYGITTAALIALVVISLLSARAARRKAEAVGGT